MLVKNDLAERARAYATQAHARIGHRRKYTLDPYDVHLQEVADLVASATDDPEMIAAAWLHDTVEDTPATFEDIEREFGPAVARLVMELTDISRPGDGNRAVRKAMDLKHTADASPRAKTIKLADIIDNTLDISRHDPRFARVYLAEIASLLAVLREGDPRLYARAVNALEASARRLKIAVPLPAVPDGEPWDQAPGLAVGFSDYRTVRLFTEAFTARHILEPLLSTDSAVSPRQEGSSIPERRGAVMGVRHQGRVTGYVVAGDVGEGEVPAPRSINRRQVVELEAPLTEVINILTLFDHCFVALEGEVVGVVGKEDIEKPVVRMWLFGMIILVEMVVVEVIRRHWPDDAWQSLLSEGRIEKARLLKQERDRRRLPADLLDCLQFSDKVRVVLRDPAFFRQTGFESMAAAKRALKELEALRNNLAHGQEIGTHDWPAIVRLTRRLGSASGN